jgi:hypothetical protein
MGLYGLVVKIPPCEAEKPGFDSLQSLDFSICLLHQLILKVPLCKLYREEPVPEQLL